MNQPRPVTVELLDRIQDGFNRHDVPAILGPFADDCEWLMARGPDPWEARRPMELYERIVRECQERGAWVGHLGGVYRLAAGANRGD